MQNSNPFIFKARKNIAWVQDKQAINFRSEPHQSCFLNTAQVRAVRTESHNMKEEELFLIASVRLQAPRGSSFLFQIQLKLSRVPVLRGDKEVENQWLQPRTPLQTRRNGIFLEPEIMSCKTPRARQREGGRFLWGSVVYI